MNATIISIGNELLNGKTINSNASYIGRALYEIGIVTERILTIRDEHDSITDALQSAVAHSDLVIVTGGLGPTHDDITRKTIAAFFNTPLVLNLALLARIEALFASRGITMPEVNRNQAFVPESATLLSNPVGTAAGLLFKDQDTAIFVLPGVPLEMKAILDNEILPYLKRSYQLQQIPVYLYRTTAIAESRLYERCRELFSRYPQLEIAFLPRFIGVDIRISLRDPSRMPAKDYEQFEQQLYACAGKYIYTRGTEELEETVGKILLERGKTLAVAESCTGGMLQNRITHVAGASAYFLGGVVSYSNESKMHLLGITETSLVTHGAVSETVASEMAGAVRQKFSSDYGLATTGIAGPGGGSEDKPVGLVYIAVASAGGVQARRFLMGEGRILNKKRSTQAALEMMRRQLLEIS